MDNEIFMTLTNLLEDGMITQEQFDQALENEELAETLVYTVLYGEI